MTSDGGYAALESLDGRWLYYTRLDRPGLLRRPTAGGPADVVAADVRAEELAELGRARPRRLLPHVAGRRRSAAGDRRCGSRAPRLLARLPDCAWSGIAVSRDGARLIYAHADRRDANIGGLLVAR